MYFLLCMEHELFFTRAENCITWNVEYLSKCQNFDIIPGNIKIDLIQN